LNEIWHKAVLAFDKDLGTIGKPVAKRAEASEAGTRLMIIPFIGSVSVTVTEYVIEGPSLFCNVRQFAAYGCFTLSHAGTSDKITVTGVDH